MFGKSRREQNREIMNGYVWVIHRKYFTADEASLILDSIFEAVSRSLLANGYRVPGTGLDDKNGGNSLKRFSGERNGYISFHPGDGVYMFSLHLDESSGPITNSERAVIEAAVSAGVAAGKRLSVLADTMHETYQNDIGHRLPWHMF